MAGSGILVQKTSHSASQEDKTIDPCSTTNMILKTLEQTAVATIAGGAASLLVNTIAETMITGPHTAIAHALITAGEAGLTGFALAVHDNYKQCYCEENLSAPKIRR